MSITRRFYSIFSLEHNFHTDSLYSNSLYEAVWWLASQVGVIGRHYGKSVTEATITIEGYVRVEKGSGGNDSEIIRIEPREITLFASEDGRCIIPQK